MSEFVIRIGDTVQHDYSKELGKVLAWRKNKLGYDHKVSFYLKDFDNYRTDWYRREVLVAPTKEDK
jgi:hypothetical protein